MPDVRPLPLCNGWTSRHAEKLKHDEQWHRTQGTRNGKPWTLEADGFTRRVLADCQERALAAETATEYRRVYTRLAAEGITAWDKANSAQHWNKLRTACRWAMAEDIRAWRKASEQARKAGDLARAQSCTTEAWRLAVALDEQFLKHGHATWASKAAAMKAQGRKPVDKSKRRTNAPTADMAPCALLDTRHRGTRLAERHSERLALLALTGCRPAELMAGVELTLIRDKQGQPNGLGVEIKGAKVDAQRGHILRRLVFPLAGSGQAVRGLAMQCAEHGGRYTLATTRADYRSLNCALQTHGLSCYAFRHAVGGDLKAEIADGKATAEHAAKVMGHRSTASLLSYGMRRRGRAGQRPRAGVSGAVKVDSVTRAARARARAGKKKTTTKANSVGAAPIPKRPVPQTPLTRGLRPPR
ncbi:hypothetical protein EA662_02200 [Pseudoxanthomonas winnipegensis]|uniref:hypothetical protein n=1 Tax=Pseudoxanthomonas winnipegensis TaxID=2480810 RepID=UPI00102DCB0C|nr:hypothetical protein [Pseudoxanthomonas winnipegensis]RZZ89221.1 hypothetical protein EA662_02200 [Pseudoxanthomonas winnipegensis]